MKWARSNLENHMNFSHCNNGNFHGLLISEKRSQIDFNGDKIQDTTCLGKETGLKRNINGDMKIIGGI